MIGAAGQISLKNLAAMELSRYLRRALCSGLPSVPA
ncbi:hypothetical protein AZ54_06195 [Xanthomonas oryzae pv. oryzae PXO86]|nr:hypothetical protein AZ54_06195 [Xanthomonas oryzae pv. oryzae PXO86]